MKYRACNTAGLRFTAHERTVQFGSAAPYTLATSPSVPDMFESLTAFSSREDPGTSAYGTWLIPEPGAQAVRPAGVTWRSIWPGRFAPDGVYYLSGNDTKATYHTWKNGVLSAPIPTGTTNIEGIADFTFTATGYVPVWQNRAKPVTEGPYTFSQYFKTGAWFFGLQKGTQWSLARDGAGVWYLVTKKTSQVLPCVHAQTDGTLLVAWNGDAESFLWSGDGWPVLSQIPAPAPPDEDEEMAELESRVTKLEARLAALTVRVERLEAEPEPLPEPEPEPEPEPGEPVIDLATVTWLHTDVSGWAVTSRIESVGIEWPKGGDRDNGTVCFPHTKAGQWPTFDNGQGEGNVWVFGKVNGQWYAATCEWLKPGQTCKRFSNQTAADSWGIGPHTKKSPLKSWGPTSGEWIGIMVSTRARDSGRSINPDGSFCLERSNVAMVRWP